MEKKTNELLLLESILRYTQTEGTSLDLPFTNPLLGGSELLREINWSQICPPPPTLNGNSNAIDACECWRWEGRAVCVHAARQSMIPMSRCHPSSPANPTQPVPPYQVYKWEYIPAHRYISCV